MVSTVTTSKAAAAVRKGNYETVELSIGAVYLLVRIVP